MLLQQVMYSSCLKIRALQPGVKVGRITTVVRCMDIQGLLHSTPHVRISMYSHAEAGIGHR